MFMNFLLGEDLGYVFDDDSAHGVTLKLLYFNIDIIIRYICSCMEQISQKLIQAYRSADYKIYLETPTQSAAHFQLKFRQQCLTISNSNGTAHQLQFDDLIGFNEQIIGGNLYRLKINSFARRLRSCCKQQRRETSSVNIWVRLDQQYYQILKVDLLRVTTNRRIKSSSQKLNFMIYLNPNAGANSSSHFQNVVNFLRLTNLSYQVIQTTGRGHCKEHLNSLDISKYEGVIIISGDGLIHQFVNSAACGKIPVTHVPGGSGNAFAKTQTSLAGQLCRDEEAIYLAVKGKVRPTNIIKIELQREPEPIYSFHSLQWAFVADIDMNSQFLRCCGGFRFEIFSAYRCFALHRYPGKLTFSTSEVHLPPLSHQITSPAFKVVETEFLNVIFMTIPFISDKYQWSPLLKVQDEAIDMQYITAENGRFQLMKFLLNSDNGDHFDKQKKTPKQGFEFTHAKLKSYRLEPTGQGYDIGIFGIDGQMYEAQRMQASMSDKKVLIYA